VRHHALPVLLVLLPAGCKKEEPPEEADPEEAAPKEAAPAEAAAETSDAPEVPEGLQGLMLPSLDAGPEEEDARVVVPNLGGHGGLLVRGWESLEPGAKAADLESARPRARRSDVSPHVYTEPLDGPWLAASYRFHPDRGRLKEVHWVGGEKTRGREVFRGLVKQGMARWRVRPVNLVEGGQRVATFDTARGRLRLRMEDATGRIRLEWTPPGAGKYAPPPGNP